MKASEIEKHEIVPTSIPLVNEILGGGFPTKIIIEIAGPKSSGKSTMALQFIAQAQRLGRPCYYADSERTIDFVPFAESLGVDCGKLEYDKQPYAELLLVNLLDWAEKKKNGIIVVDSVGALSGRQEVEKGMEGVDIGLQAKMIARFCRLSGPFIDQNNHIIILVNHTYTVIGTGAIKSSGGDKLGYHKGLSLWLKEAYGHAPKRSADGTKTVKFIEAEIRDKAKYMAAFEGRKVLLEFVPKKGFVGEFVAPIPPKKRGRPKSTAKVV